MKAWWAKGELPPPAMTETGGQVDCAGVSVAVFRLVR